MTLIKRLSKPHKMEGHVRTVLEIYQSSRDKKENIRTRRQEACPPQRWIFHWQHTPFAPWASIHQSRSQTGRVSLDSKMSFQTSWLFHCSGALTNITKLCSLRVAAPCQDSGWPWLHIDYAAILVADVRPTGVFKNRIHVQPNVLAAGITYPKRLEWACFFWYTWWKVPAIVGHSDLISNVDTSTTYS